jgi:hypothetical protein
VITHEAWRGIELDELLAVGRGLVSDGLFRGTIEAQCDNGACPGGCSVVHLCVQETCAGQAGEALACRSCGEALLTIAVTVGGRRIENACLLRVDRTAEEWFRALDRR